MTFADQLEQRGLEKGMQKGIEQGLEQVAYNMLAKGADVSSVMEITELSQQQVELIKQRLLMH